MHLRHVLLAATALAIGAPALAGPVEDFRKLQDDYWAAALRNSPVTGQLGRRSDLRSGAG